MLHLNMDQGWTILFARTTISALRYSCLHPATVVVVQTHVIHHFLHIFDHFAVFCTHQGLPHTRRGNWIQDRQPWRWHYTILRYNIKLLKRPDRDTQNINYAWWRQTRAQIFELIGMHRVCSRLAQSKELEVDSWPRVAAALHADRCDWKFIRLEIQIHQ